MIFYSTGIITCLHLFFWWWGVLKFQYCTWQLLTVIHSTIYLSLTRIKWPICLWMGRLHNRVTDFAQLVNHNSVHNSEHYWTGHNYEHTTTISSSVKDYLLCTKLLYYPGIDLAYFVIIFCPNTCNFLVFNLMCHVRVIYNFIQSWILASDKIIQYTTSVMC